VSSIWRWPISGSSWVISQRGSGRVGWPTPWLWWEEIGVEIEIDVTIFISTWYDRTVLGWLGPSASTEWELTLYFSSFSICLPVTMVFWHPGGHNSVQDKIGVTVVWLWCRRSRSCVVRIIVMVDSFINIIISSLKQGRTGFRSKMWGDQSHVKFAIILPLKGLERYWAHNLQTYRSWCGFSEARTARFR
jgi:hypothetical protein